MKRLKRKIIIMIKRSLIRSGQNIINEYGEMAKIIPSSHWNKHI